MKKIAFILPGRGGKPVGGFKIAYQYADYFAGLGYDVHAVFQYVNDDFFKSEKLSFFLKLKTFIGFYYRKTKKQIEFSSTCEDAKSPHAEKILFKKEKSNNFFTLKSFLIKIVNSK